jgi:2-polyprenyl-3-methyl-5-hydroxy-6-metoxy-1,4-benzoquinol methylase
MNDDVSDIQQHYNEDPVQEYERLSRHQLEWEMTWRYLDHYLPRQGPILEIGAGPGPYTVELAKRGYQVTAFAGAKRGCGAGAGGAGRVRAGRCARPQRAATR